MSFDFKVVIKNFVPSFFINTFNHQRLNLGIYQFNTVDDWFPNYFSSLSFQGGKFV